MVKSSEKSVPYISFSINRLPAFLTLVKSRGTIKKALLILEASRSFSRSAKTIQEFVISLKNLGLLKEEDGKISLTESSERMLLNNKKDFWEILRQELLKNEAISNILQAISLMSQEKAKVTSNEKYYNDLSEILQTIYNFASASPRELDRFITLFRKIRTLNYDPFLDEYFIVRKHKIDDESLEKIVREKYEKIKSEMLKRTGTSWVPIDQLRSGICIQEEIETELLNEFLRKLLDRNGFQFAEASSSRKEVRSGGIEKNDKIYYYMKILG